MTPYYSQDGVEIYHGDCRDVLPQLPDAGLMLTDPPYGATYVSNTGGRRGKEPIGNDGTRISLRLYRQLAPTIRATHVLWFTRWDAWPDVWEILGQWLPIRGLLVWDKGTPGMGDLNHWGPSYELIASLGRGKTTGTRDQSVLKFAGVTHTERRHPTEKPLALLQYLIGKMPLAPVIDPFCGSGATLHAARNVGLPAIGVETDERYCEEAAKRLGQGSLFAAH